MSACPRSHPPDQKHWHHAVADKEDIWRLEQHARNANYPHGHTRAAMKGHRVFGAFCTDAEWTEITRGIHLMHRA